MQCDFSNDRKKFLPYNEYGQQLQDMGSLARTIMHAAKHKIDLYYKDADGNLSKVEDSK